MKFELPNNITNGHEVISMSHAYRVNGVVDIWYNRKKIFDLIKKEYKEFSNTKELFIEALLIINSNEKREPFKKTVIRKRMTYQEFKHKKTW